MKKKLCIIALSFLVICYLFTINAINASADESWKLSIKAIGQVVPNGENISIAIIGIDPNAKAYPYALYPPPNYTVILKTQDPNMQYNSEETRLPGSEQEVWNLQVTTGGEEMGGAAVYGGSGFYPVLTWDPNERGPSEVLDLRLGDANGPVILDMRTNNTYQTAEADAVSINADFDYVKLLYAVVFEPAPTYYRDSDGDGYGDPNDTVQSETSLGGYVMCVKGDCDDADPNTYQGAPELCDGKDNNCDGVIPLVETTDTDGDGVVDCNDCDEVDPNTYPGATELCDGKDNDCDGQIDPNEVDNDGDGMSECEGDCDDTDEYTYLGAQEICDTKDNDCNGSVDDNVTYSDYYRDADGDGYGDPNDSQYDCKPPDVDYVLDPNDCDDTDDAINPGATEICDGIDNDCDGIVDDPSVLTYADYYRDADGDGYGDLNDSVNECTQPDGYVLDPNDCDDMDADVNPDATEVYDGIDNDCNGEIDEHCYFVIDLYATGQDVIGQPLQQVYVTFGLHSGYDGTDVDPNNWADDIVRLQLIDPNADLEDPNNLVDTDYLVEDIRKPVGLPEILWYVLVEIGEMADPNLPGYYPVLSWDPNNLGCTEVKGKEYLYELRRGLGASGAVLVDNMADANSYQTVSQDGDPTQYLTILWREKPVPPPPPKRQILPWPGISNALGWVGFPYFPGGLPVSPLRSGYPPGLSIPSFPGTYPGFSYPGGRYPAWTPFVPRFPATFPTLGIFAPIGTGWSVNYWTGFPRAFSYRTGWFYRY